MNSFALTDLNPKQLTVIATATRFQLYLHHLSEPGRIPYFIYVHGYDDLIMRYPTRTKLVLPIRWFRWGECIVHTVQSVTPLKNVYHAR